MAIKKTAKMSAAPKKVAAKAVAKKADPGKGVVAGAVAASKKIASIKNNKPKSDAQKAAQFSAERRETMREFDKASKYTKNMTPGQSSYLERLDKKQMAASDSTKKYTQKSLENIKNLNRKK